MNCVKIIISTFLIFIISTIRINAQNHVPNGDFEQLKKCPRKLDQIKYAIGWKSPTKGTPDLFNNCCSQYYLSKVLPKKKFVGSEKPIEGDGYAGIIISIPNLDKNSQVAILDPYREYIQSKLKTTLSKGKKYIIKMDISLADKSVFCTNKLQILFSEKKIKSRTSSILFSSLKYVDCYNGGYIENKKGWVSICNTFIAKGNENFITIGMFDYNFDFKEVSRKRTSLTPKNIYYYIDSISIELYDENNPNHKCVKKRIDKVYDL